ncbi:MAG: hypothetical protein KKG00_05115 [Bacteroidetes bacterium]|nr:hypothetical protein [Bacteroidota bacterium]
MYNIQNIQSADKLYFLPGLVPAYRSNKYVLYNRCDTTIFFSAITAFTLGTLREKVSVDCQNSIDEVVAEIKKNYPAFRNKDGLKTYNFWQTRPSQHFPNGYLFHRFEHFRIPDDIDDTAFVYLTDDPTEEELRWLKHKLTLHANGTARWIRNTYPEYRKLRAYSTWFGKNMYIEFDACVLSNILYLIFQSGLPLNQHDTDSLAYIRSVIETNRYLTEPFRCAHQYPHTALIVYHVARLLAAFSPEGLQGIREKLIADSWELLAAEPHPMYRVLLATSLLRLGEQPPRLAVENYSEKDFEGFYFFIAGLLTAYEHPLLYRMASWKVFHMHWTCEAHCWALLAEYECLYRAAAEPSAPGAAKQD